MRVTSRWNVSRMKVKAVKMYTNPILADEDKPAEKKSPSFVPYHKADEGLVVKEAQYIITQMNFNNTGEGYFEEDNAIDKDTVVRLTLWELDTKTNRVKNRPRAEELVDMSPDQAKRLHVGDKLMVRVVVPDTGETSD